MINKHDILSKLLLLIGLLKLTHGEDQLHPNAYVSYVTPTKIGNGGGVIQIYGANFAADNFNQFDPSLGNKIYFSNEYETVECATPVERTWALQNPQASSKTKVTCELPARGTLKGSSYYSMTMYVDSLKVNSVRSIEYASYKTPSINQVLSKTYVRVKELVTFRGTLYTDYYGNSGAQDDSLGVDNEGVEIVSVFVGPKECNMANSVGELYGVKLDEDALGNKLEEGNITCRLSGTYIGPHEVELYVSGGYGNSQTSSNVAYVDSLGQLYQFHTLPEIEAVNYQSGAATGGQSLVVTGSGFDSNPGMTQVKIGNDECEISSITSESITCLTPPASAESSGTLTPGNAGLRYELWKNAPVVDPSATWKVLEGTPPDFSTVLEQYAEIEEPVDGETSGFTARMYGFLVAPYTGRFVFTVAASDNAALFLSNSSDPESASNVINCSTPASGCSSLPTELKEGQMYFLAVIHHHKIATTTNNMLRLSLSSPKSPVSSSDTYMSISEMQTIYLNDQKRDEIQTIKISSGLTNQFFLTLGGKNPLVPFSAYNPVTEWPKKFREALNPRCQYYPENPDVISAYVQGAESTAMLKYQQGSHVEDQDAFCGSGVVSWAYRLIGGVNVLLNDYKFVCFALKGTAFLGRLDVLINYYNKKTKDNRGYWLNPTVFSSNEWSYQCLDILNYTKTFFEENHPGSMDYDKPIYLNYLHIPYSYDISKVALVDELRFVKEEVMITRTASPMLPDDGEFITEKMQVEDVSTGTDKEYKLTYQQYSCPKARFPLFGIASATPGTLCTLVETNSTDPVAINNYLSDETNSNATFYCADWPPGKTITISRQQQMSLAMQGNYSITFNGSTVNIPIYTQQWDLYPIVDAGWGYGCTINYWGRCWAQNFRFVYDCEGGDQPLLSVSSENIISDGTVLQFGVYHNRNGSLLISKMGPDFFRTPETSLQVSLMVNDYPAWCTQTDCSYNYDAGLNPSVTSISLTPESTPGTYSLNIVGSGFTDSDDISVLLNKLTQCQVQQTTTTQIDCMLVNPVAGEYAVEVFVRSKGKASQDSPLPIVIPMQITSVSPSTSSIGGGTEITVQGSGFSPDMSTVTINDQICEQISATGVQIVCVTPPAQAGTYPVKVIVGTVEETYDGIVYDAQNTPTVSSLDPVKSPSPLGNVLLTIQGNAFGSQKGSVRLCSKDCPVQSWSNTQITCILPPNGNSMCPPIIAIPGNGFADVSGVQPVEYAFKVTDISPNVGSVLGGTIVKIVGEGFTNDNCQALSIRMGEMYSCTILECSDTMIKCRTEKKQKTVIVKNTGSHPIFGLGYKWKPQHVTILPGDTIQWQWSLGSASLDSGINIFEVDKLGQLTYNQMGFHSGPKSLDGYYARAFRGIGTSFYASDSVVGEDSTAFLTGSVTVALPETAENVSIVIGFHQNLTAAHAVPPAPNGFTPDDNCLEGANSDEMGSTSTEAFFFKFSQGSTPVVDDVKLSGGSEVTVSTNRGALQGKSSPVFEIIGQNFGADADCQKLISIGNNPCVITSSNDTSIICEASGLEAETTHDISVIRLNYGNAAILGVHKAEYSPVSFVSDIAPLEGSILGGGILTVSGSGFISPDGAAVVVFVGPDQVPRECTIISKTDTEIDCKIPKGFEEYLEIEVEASVFVRIGLKQYPPAQKDGLEDTFKYMFKQSLTPTIASIDSSSTLAAGSGTITISGDGFGNAISSISASLVPPTVARRKRSIDLHDHLTVRQVEHTPLRQLSMSKFFDKQLEIRPEIQWKSAGSSGAKSSLKSFTRQDRTLRKVHPGVAIVFEDDFMEDPMEAEENENQRAQRQAFFNRHKRSTLEQSISRHLEKINSHRVFRQMEATDSTSIPGTITSATNTSIEITFANVPAGTYNLEVIIENVGSAQSNANASQITSSGEITSVTPSSGSTFGGQEIEIVGSGFHNMDATSVNIGGVDCMVTKASFTAISCITGSNNGDEALAATLSVTSGGVTFPASSYDYNLASTPVVTTSTPSSGNPGDTFVLGGTIPLGMYASVWLGPYMINATIQAENSIDVVLPEIPGGVTYEVVVLVGGYGYADTTGVTFEVNLDITAVSPIEGSKGGGSTLSITGVGFAANATVTVCDSPCIMVETTGTLITCITPADNTTDASNACDVVLTLGEATITSTTKFTYQAALTPSVTTVMPNSGGSGGGTRITITGTGFEASGNEVAIDGSACVIVSESTTEIQCDTEAHTGSGTYPVDVTVPGKGKAALPNDGSVTFKYIDRWSSIWTWGGLGVPLEGEFIVIEAGQEIVLDVTTPKLTFLLINGGKLTFDRDADGLQLNSEYILILNDGVLEIGTEDEPYLNEASIMLHGHTRCIELPIYGCKVLGVRKGTLDLHGSPVVNTWTHLSETAEAGATIVRTVLNVSDWQVGDEIVIPSTSHRHSMEQNEKRKIKAVLPDGKSLELDQPLTYKHISIAQDFDGETVETRAEIGRLTRNVKILGSIHEEFLEVIPACKKSFDSNQFATQSCFNGKFGEELGSDEFGAVTLFNAKNPNMFEANIHLSYVEFFWVGQAFRVGRYPIHFHLLGNVTGSYARGCGIHNSFNRAMTIHGITGVLAEKIVTFDIKGLSFFIEDGIEEGNVVRRNLAVYTKQSSSLLNPDVTPAAFWVVNPNNQIYENAAAGGTHFGFWYRIQRNPDGPSETTSYCSNNVPLDIFRDNSAHTFGWYGLWIFSMAGYFPKDGTKEKGYCDGENDVPAKFERLKAWRCERGAEVVFSGPVQFHDFIMLDNEKAGMEFVEVDGGYGPNGPGVFGGMVVGHSDISMDDEDPNYCTHEGIIGPKLWNSNVNGTKFFNFDRPTCYSLGTCSQCTALTASFPVQTEGLTFVNSPNKVVWRWLHSGSFNDVDGSLTGTPGATVIPKADIYPPECAADSGTDFSGNNITGAICDPAVSFGRVSFNKPLPASLLYNDVIVTTEYGSEHLEWRKKDITHKAGWNGLFPLGTIIHLEWNNHTDMTNMSYELSAWNLENPGNYMLIQHTFNQKPDMIGVVPNSQPVFLYESLTTIPDETSLNGEFNFDNDTLTLTYVLSGKTTVRRKRGLGLTSFSISSPQPDERRSNLDIFRCLFLDCLPPPPPDFPIGRPDVVFLWSDSNTWTTLGILKPTTGQNLDLPGQVYLIVDEPLPELGVITIYDFATLELSDTMDHVINCTHIFLHGGQLIAGSNTDGSDHDFKHSITINLLGDPLSNDFPLPEGPIMGAKAIGVFGRLKLSSKETTKAWTKLGATAVKGSKTITLKEAVDWKVGAKIIVSTSSFVASEAERLTIAAISQNGLAITTVESLKHDHSSNTYTIDGKVITMAAEVGLLSRRIKIVGAPYPDQILDEFGCRVIVGTFVRDGVVYTGEARLDNVEFVNCGQRGFVENYDPRYALAFLNTGESGSMSHVKKCSFNYNYNAALGVFGTEQLVLEENVAYRAFGKGMVDEGKNNTWHNNLVAYVIFEGIHLKQPHNFEFNSCFDINEAKLLEFIGNVAAGCERGGIETEGEPCDPTGDWADSAAPWTGNEVHGTMHGVRVKAIRSHNYGSKCGAFNNFLIWKVYDYGFYLHTMDDVEVSGSIVLDTTNGVLPFGFSPPSKSHAWKEGYFKIENSLFVGTTANFDCSSPPPITANEMPQNWNHGGSVRNVGILFPIFGSGGVGFGKPWHFPMNYNTIRGTMYITNLTFANYGAKCGKNNFAIRTHPDYADMVMPIIANGTKFIDVADNFKVWYDFPSLKEVNPSDCVDMPCDALKKTLLIDLDGTITGTGVESTIIPDASYQWDGDQSYGTGYYRVPKPLVTSVTGSKLPFSQVAPNIGVIQDNTCTKQMGWNNAIYCTGLKHRLLVLESMDVDNEIRRLSPIAVVSDNKFIDLVNGPQDHGWCFGYTCQERLSTFHLMAAIGHTFEVMMTSTPPQYIRYHLLHSTDEEVVVVKFWYPKRQRYDVFVNGIFVEANNGITNAGRYDLAPPADSYIPDPSTATHGENFYDPRTGHLYVAISGSNNGIVDVKMQPVVVFKFGGTVSNADFFDVNPVSNIANLLGIDPSRIRIANIVRENSRRKRATGTATNFEMTIEVGPPMSTTIDPNDNGTQATNSYADVLSSASKVISKVMSGLASDPSLGISVTTTSTVEEPLPPPVQPTPIDETQTQATSGPTFADVSQKNASLALQASVTQTAVSVPKNIRLAGQGLLRMTTSMLEMELMSFDFFLTDIDGATVTFPSTIAPWTVGVEIVEGPTGGDIRFSGTASECEFDSDGICTFTFGLTKSGDHVLNFTVYNSEGNPASTLTPYRVGGVNVGPRPLDIKFETYPDVLAMAEKFPASVLLWDAALDQMVTVGTTIPTDISCELTLGGEASGTLGGATTKALNSPTFTSSFADLSIDLPGKAYTLTATCSGTGFSAVLTGPKFVVYTVPEMTTVKKQSIGMRYTGDITYVIETINAMNHVMVDGQDNISIIDLNTGSPPADKYIDISKYNADADPLCYRGITCQL